MYLVITGDDIPCLCFAIATCLHVSYRSEQRGYGAGRAIAEPLVNVILGRFSSRICLSQLQMHGHAMHAKFYYHGPCAAAEQIPKVAVAHGAYACSPHLRCLFLQCCSCSCLLQQLDSIHFHTDSVEQCCLLSNQACEEGDTMLQHICMQTQNADSTCGPRFASRQKWVLHVKVHRHAAFAAGRTKLHASILQMMRGQHHG